MGCCDEKDRMLISKSQHKGCCGQVQFIFQLSKPIKRNHVKFFVEAGYFAPDHMSNAGLFYVQKDHLIANCSFGATQFKVRCTGSKCTETLDEFEKILELALAS